jgi:hypothetical protein
MTLAPLAVGLLFATMAYAINITDATLSGGIVTVSGNHAAKNAPISWEGQLVASSSKGGAFIFTTAAVPLDCVGTVFDGVSTVDVAIAGCTPTPPPPTTAFPATGQTTCYDSSGNVIDCPNTGQDGDIRAGAALSYANNGDGTITDNNTGLMWAKKDDNNVDELHDKDTVYTWADAFAVHIAGLNSAAFGGHTDWRLPNAKELQSIVNYGQVDPAVSSEFNTNCATGVDVLTGSCTAASFYWTSSSFVSYPTDAWFVYFGDGSVFAFPKSDKMYVRAVRGGL